MARSFLLGLSLLLAPLHVCCTERDSFTQHQTDASVIAAAGVPADGLLDIPTTTSDSLSPNTDLASGLCVEQSDGGWGAPACSLCPSPPVVDSYVGVDGGCEPLAQCSYRDHSCGALTECFCRGQSWQCTFQECI